MMVVTVMVIIIVKCIVKVSIARILATFPTRVGFTPMGIHSFLIPPSARDSKIDEIKNDGAQNVKIQVPQACSPCFWLTKEDKNPLVLPAQCYFPASCLYLFKYLTTVST